MWYSLLMLCSWRVAVDAGWQLLGCSPWLAGALCWFYGDHEGRMLLCCSFDVVVRQCVLSCGMVRPDALMPVGRWTVARPQLN